MVFNFEHPSFRHSHSFFKYTFCKYMYVNTHQHHPCCHHGNCSSLQGSDSEYEVSDVEGEEEESFMESGAESSEWEEPGRGRRMKQKGAWLVSDSDSDYRPGRGGGRRGRRKGKAQRDHWNRKSTRQ